MTVIPAALLTAIAIFLSALSAPAGRDLLSHELTHVQQSACGMDALARLEGGARTRDDERAEAFSTWCRDAARRDEAARRTALTRTPGPAEVWCPDDTPFCYCWSGRPGECREMASHCSAPLECDAALCRCEADRAALSASTDIVIKGSKILQN